MAKEKEIRELKEEVFSVEDILVEFAKVEEEVREVDKELKKFWVSRGYEYGGE